jgi:23S rRNA pseudouridine1911/1915/1917 synthase
VLNIATVFLSNLVSSVHSSLILSGKMPEMRAGIQTDVRRRPQAEDGALTVLFEDDWIVVVHPTYKNTSGTLLNAVLWHVRGRAGVQPGILTRLDKDTSGLVVMALTPEVHALMQRRAAAGRVHKQYLALVRGVPEPRAGRINLPLARDAGDRRRVVVTPAGAACETRYDVAATDGTVSLVRCEPITGRTHQIRVHLSASGWPILGDRVYGEPDDSITRQALHAWRVVLPHPVRGNHLEFESPLPLDIGRLCPAFAHR